MPWDTFDITDITILVPEDQSEAADFGPSDEAISKAALCERWMWPANIGWLVVWTIFEIFPYNGNNHPN